MKWFAVFIWVLSASGLYAQDGSREKAVLELIRIGLAEGKLPGVLVNAEDSINYPQTVVAIETNNENKLEKGYHLPVGSAEAWIWTKEELTSYEPYWLVPSAIEFEGDEISFNFVTQAVGRKKDKVLYEGTIRGRKNDDQWTLRKCKVRKR
jgi:hypothetical protein